MNRLIEWMNQNFAPKMNKVTRNAWVSSIQESIMSILPLILVGSLITLISILNNFFPSLPDLSPLSSFSFGLIGLLMAFFIPFNIAEKKGHGKKKVVAGGTGLAFYLMLLFPTFGDDGTVTFIFSRFGPNGMFVALITGLFVGLVIHLTSKLSFFKNSTSLPDFVIVWFDSLLPITLILLSGWLFVYQFQIDLFAVIVSGFQPLSIIGQSFGGFVLICFIYAFLYSFGISPWALASIVYPIQMQAISDNAALVSKGLAPSFINSFEVVYSGWVAIGGVGATLPLVILMLMAKSARLRAFGKATLAPSIVNINEPVVFGAPIAFNPILMIPMWINAIALSSITYVVLNLGMVTIPSKPFQLWYMPFGISTYLINSDFRGVILLGVLIVVSFVIWYPFFKAYDIQEARKEREEEAAAAAAQSA